MPSTMTRLRSAVLSPALLALPLLSSACATVTYHPVLVSIESKPAGASIYIDGDSVGQTPRSVALSNMSDKHVEIDHPDYGPFHTPLSAYSRFNGRTLLNVIWFPGIFVDLATGASLVPLPSMPVDLTALPAPAAQERLEFYRIPELRPPAEGGRLVLFSWEARGDERKRVVSGVSWLQILVDGRKIRTLGARGVLSEVLPAGPHLIEVRGRRGATETASVLIAQGKTSYAGMRFIEVGRAPLNRVGDAEITYDAKLETDLPEKDVIRFVYSLLKKKR